MSENNIDATMRFYVREQREIDDRKCLVLIMGRVRCRFFVGISQKLTYDSEKCNELRTFWSPMTHFDSHAIAQQWRAVGCTMHLCEIITYYMNDDTGLYGIIV